MRIYYWLIWSVVASVTTQNVSPRSDPLADVCSPLCSNETTRSLEVDCGEHRGCSDLDAAADPLAVLACWAPCVSAAEGCFSLCADNFDDILRKCYDNCSQDQNPLDCIAVCFNTSFLDIQQGLQIKTDNSTSDTNSSLSEQSEVNRSQTTTAVNTSHPGDVPTVAIQTIDTVLPSADTDIASRSVHTGMVDDTKFHLNNTLESHNGDTSDYKMSTKLYTLLSRLVTDIFYTKRWKQKQP